MRTREESLNNFCRLVDELINSRYLLAGTKIFDVMTAVNSSKLLTEMFNYFTENYDFEEGLTSCFSSPEGDGRFTLPKKNTDVLALVYLLLREINYKHLALTDVLDCFDCNKNYDLAFRTFGQEVLLPFKSYAYQIGRQMINGTQSESEAKVTAISVKEEAMNSEKTAVKQPEPSVKEIPAPQTSKENEISRSADYLKILRLIDLDKLAVTQSRTGKDEKAELLYVLDLFSCEIKKGDPERINLIYLAYVYALRPYRKIKTNVKEITETLYAGQE